MWDKGAAEDEPMNLENLEKIKQVINECPEPATYPRARANAFYARTHAPMGLWSLGYS
jgi:hypothetical protein